MKKRIWELDVLRGVCILGMVVVHLIYDLQTFFSLPFLADSRLFDLIKQWGGVLFLLISGICVTLGSHPVRRGLIVFACGLLKPGGLFVLEHGKDLSFAEHPRFTEHRHYGSVNFSFFRAEEPADARPTL